MPTSADTPLPPRAHAPRFARTLLLAALGAGLVGLGLPGSPALVAAPTAPSTLIAAAAVGPALDPAAPRVRALTPVLAPKKAAVRRTVRATRTRRPAAPSWVLPVYAGVSSPFGPRWGRMHKGVDFNASYGARVRSIGGGTVLGAGYLPGESGYGIIVLVRHRNGVVSAYAHLSKALVHAGERVRAGETIGRVGNTGHSFGAHLHFEIRVGGSQVNPVRWLRRHSVRV